MQDPSLLPESQRLQSIIARGDYALAKALDFWYKISTSKALRLRGGLPRKPLPPIAATDAEALWVHPHVQELVQLEKELGGQFLGK